MTSFEQLYNTYFKRVYAYTLLRVRNPALAEDLCAAAWRKAYRHLETYDEQKGSFTQWIFTIARNEINMYRRLYWVKHLFSLTDAEEYLPSAEKSPAEQPAAQTRPSDQAAEINAPTGGREPAENRTASEEGATTEAASFLQAHKNMFGQITVWAILGAGLADGINPCAFAVIVFFVSFLAAYKYNRKEVLIVGAAYCLAVFLAYVLLGLGLFKFLYAMKGFQYVTLLVQWGTVALCALLFLLSLYDFIIYTRTKKSEKLLLQLPKSYKEYIHKVMRVFLKDKHGSVWRLTLAAFIVGFVVSAVEAVCTGQVYLPTIVVILKEADRHFWRAAEYLLLYNLMFIVPLVIVFALTLCGKESASLNGWLKRHLGLTKLILCGVFLALLLILLSALF